MRVPREVFAEVVGRLQRTSASVKPTASALRKQMAD
jgi:hypothetical protein